MKESSAEVPSTSVVTVRGLSAELKAKLRIRAAHNARSMEAEARDILERALTAPQEDETDLAAFARGLFGPLGGIDLELPSRDGMREPPGLLDVQAKTAPAHEDGHGQPAPEAAHASKASPQTRVKRGGKQA